MTPHYHRLKSRAGFTLVELMVATAVFTLLLTICIAAIGNVSDVYRRSTSYVEASQGARLGFDLVTRTLGEATLNTYFDYDNPNQPSRYIRQSDLQFVIGLAGTGPDMNNPGGGAQKLPGTPGTGSALFFQAQADRLEDNQYKGLTGTLNAVGYFVEYGSDEKWLPTLAKSKAKNRYRLIQALEPAEYNSIYAATSRAGRTLPDGSDISWITTIADDYRRPVADNVILFLARPMDPDNQANPSNFHGKYYYNSLTGALGSAIQPASANQLPPSVEITMVVIDEGVAARLDRAGNLEDVIKNSVLDGLFEDPEDFQDDLNQVSQNLTRAKIPFRVFNSAVPLRESKFTK